MTENCPPVRLEDMIGHDELLEKYTWLSAQRLNKWRALGALRFFHGAHGKIIYPLVDVESALNSDLQLEEPAPPRAKQQMTHTNSTDVDEIRERLFRKSLEANGNKPGVKRGPRRPKTTA